MIICPDMILFQFSVFHLPRCCPPLIISMVCLKIEVPHVPMDDYNFPLLVGGLEHFYCPFHIWDVILPIDELIFSRLLLNRFNHQPALIGYLQYPIVSPTKNPIVFPSVMTTSVEDVRNPTFSLLEVASNIYIYI